MRWALLVLAVIYLISQSAIGGVVRRLIARLGLFAAVGIYCSACVGFWTGLALGQWWPARSGAPWLAAHLESGLAAMALGAVWSHYVPSRAFELEQGRLLGEVSHDDATTQEAPAPSGPEEEG